MLRLCLILIHDAIGVIMAKPQPPRIHSTAIISPEAELADDVQIGPYVVIAGAVSLGPGCVIRPHATLCGPLTMGRANQVFSGAVLGERPQHFKYQGEPTSVAIGDDNTFRENVTVHRGTTESQTTRIGNKNYFMAGSHVGHDCQIGNRCIFANGALTGGHCRIADSVFLSGNSGVHQFTRIGRLAVLGAVSVSTKDIPPFIIQERINTVVGLNLVGMRRSQIPRDAVEAVRQAYDIIFRQGQILSVALALLEKEFGHVPPVMEMVSFIRQSKRGINSTHHFHDSGNQVVVFRPPVANRRGSPGSRRQRQRAAAMRADSF
jgi:UDP-N-acetylglucosamine acyltransferase